MKIRRRAHPTDPQRSVSRGVPGYGSPRNPTGVRMHRHGSELLNHNGEPVHRDAARGEGEGR